MLVVEPSSLRYEAGINDAAPQHDQLVERISLLENNIVRFAERLEQSLGVMLKQAKGALRDRQLLETLVQMLDEAGTIKQKQLERLWHAACDREESQFEENTRYEKLQALILRAYQGTERQLFTQSVKEGFENLAAGSDKHALRSLEQAAALHPDNQSLYYFLGEYFFRQNKMPLARRYLETADGMKFEHERIHLMLGIALADTGIVHDAKLKLAGVAHPTYAAHYALGRLSALEDDWTKALAEFKRALTLRECPEAHYLIGLAYYQLARPRLALRHIVKVIELDEQYGEAYYLLGLIHLNLKEGKRAGESFATARLFIAGLPLIVANKKTSEAAFKKRLLLLFFGAAKQGKRLLTSGDKRLAALMREDALAFLPLAR